MGAGAIIKFNGTVKGLTTAAGMWVVSIIGLVQCRDVCRCDRCCDFFVPAVRLS
ncbi:MULTISPECIES: hypothetical protein [unclassified Brevibacillus]|uniref:hypothetical protein n=1 Tax=unclassified Brevibacillus TaxID=2684853 RepID=UPI0035613F4A